MITMTPCHQPQFDIPEADQIFPTGSCSGISHKRHTTACLVQAVDYISTTQYGAICVMNFLSCFISSESLFSLLIISVYYSILFCHIFYMSFIYKLSLSYLSTFFCHYIFSRCPLSYPFRGMSNSIRVVPAPDEKN